MPAPGDNTINLAQCLRDESNEIGDAIAEIGRLMSQRTRFLEALVDERTKQLAYAWAQADSSYQLEMVPIDQR